MEEPEEIVDDSPLASRVALTRRCVERQQRVSRGGQVFLALGEVVFEKSFKQLVGHGDYARAADRSALFSSVRAVAARVCGAKGFVM